MTSLVRSSVGPQSNQKTSNQSLFWFFHHTGHGKNPKKKIIIINNLNEYLEKKIIIKPLPMPKPNANRKA